MAGLSPEAKKDRINKLEVWYKKTTGKDNPPAALKTAFLQDNGSWDFERVNQWIRNNDKNWMNTEDAKKRVGMLKTLYRNTFGALTTFNSKEFRRQAEAFARSSPRQDPNEALIRIFKRRIMPSKAFNKAIPGGKAVFMEWVKQQPPGMDLLTATNELSKLMQEYRDQWDSIESGKEIPKELLIEAIKNNWKSDSPQFLKAIAARPEYSGTQSYEQRLKDFEENWGAMFEAPLNQEMADKYARSGSNWDTFFDNVVTESAEFKTEYPDYASWKSGEIGEGGVDASGISSSDYFKDRQDFIEAWQRAYEDGSPVDQELLDRAMKENWSVPQFENEMRKLPSYTNTKEGKMKTESFDLYWKNMFGGQSTPDEAIRAQFIASGYTDASSMWDEIKKTQSFREQYRDWDAFEAAQTAIGQNVVSDPAAYNRYKAEFEKAFADIGMTVPTGLESQIFASGVSGEDLQGRAQVWNTTKEAYQLQTGEKSDLVQTMGIGTELTAAAPNAAQMRERLQKALEQQKAYSRSKFNTKNTNKENNLVTQNI